LGSPYKFTSDPEKIPKINTWTISNGKIINKIKISSSPFVNLRAAGIKGGETLAYFFFSPCSWFFFGKLASEMVNESTLRKKLPWRPQIWLGREEREIVSAIEKKKQIN